MTTTNKKYVSIKQAADLLGVCQQTLRLWDSQDKLKPVRTEGNHRRYLLNDIVKVKEENDNNIIPVALYCRVSSGEQKQKGDLERQVGRVSSYCIDKGYHIIDKFEEVGSGMSDTRPKLKKLFKLVEERKIKKVIVEHKDRLVRFMYNIIVDYFKSYGVEIEYIEDVLGKTYEQELVEDILSLMASFSNKIYGKRSASNRKKKKEQKQQQALIEQSGVIQENVDG